MYDTENITKLLNKEEIKIRLGLREKYPHFLEYIEIKTGFGTITIERIQ